MAKFARDWTWLHGECFTSVDNDLRQFINYLDQEITKVVGLNPPQSSKEASQVHFSSIVSSCLAWSLLN